MTNLKGSIHIYVNRVILVWIVMISIFIASAVFHSSTTSNFYKFGPNSTLAILGIKIDTSSKYTFVIVYCIVNSVMRNANGNILSPWLINTIQNDSIVKPKHIVPIAYEITFVKTLYGWFDWLIYVNIFFSQIDFVIIEFVSDIILSIIITSYYLRNKPSIELTQPSNDEHDTHSLLVV